MPATPPVSTRADLILLRTDAALTAPVSEAPCAVLVQAGAGEIETVIADGRRRKHGGRLVYSGASAVFARLQARAEEARPRPLACLPGWAAARSARAERIPLHA